jgi:hypothetical protein
MDKVADPAPSFALTTTVPASPIFWVNSLCSCSVKVIPLTYCDEKINKIPRKEQSTLFRDCVLQRLRHELWLDQFSWILQ